MYKRFYNLYSEGGQFYFVSQLKWRWKDDLDLFYDFKKFSKQDSVSNLLTPTP